MLPYRATKPMQGDLLALAKQLETAHDYTRANVGSKLGVIVEQMRSLQMQAHRVGRGCVWHYYKRRKICP